jgi:Mg-chelatase subunit ChlD
MKLCTSVICTALAATLALAETAPSGSERSAPPAARVDVVFALDTTGSMSALIEGAKLKIWSIADEIARGKPTPELRIGLVAYRDRGDEYVTQRTDLTSDLDHVYTRLMGFRADGGGDGPEHVNLALKEALETMSWSREDSALRVVFLVGDAPPHEDYGDPFDHKSLARQAAQAGILVNAIRCGGDPNTGRVWQAIARAAGGVFISIDQSGGMAELATPYDAELAELGGKLDSTAVAYGTVERQREVRDEASRATAYATSAPAEARASRATAKGKMSGHVMYRSDLIGALEAGTVKLEEVPAEELPEEMRSMSPEQQRTFVDQKLRERRELLFQIQELDRKRAAFVKEQLQKSGEKDAFDLQVNKAIHEQARAKGIDYED